MGLKRICSCSEASVSGAVEFAIDQRSSSLMSGMVMIMKGSMRKEMRQRMKMIYLDTAQADILPLESRRRNWWAILANAGIIGRMTWIIQEVMVITNN